MKRFASHCLYSSLATKYVRYYIEVSAGRVIKADKLVHEIESTVWLNGSIILSPVLFKATDSFLLEDIISGQNDCLIALKEENIPTELYAYYTPFLDIKDISGISVKDLLLLSDQ